MEEEGEDDWGRERVGRTAVAREGRMVEVQEAGKKKNKSGKSEMKNKKVKMFVEVLPNGPDYSVLKHSAALLTFLWARHSRVQLLVIQ